MILNLAVWFALHVVFAEVRTWRWQGLAIDLPVPASLDPAALVLTIGAVVAVFWLRLGIVPLLAIWALLGLALNGL